MHPMISFESTLSYSIVLINMLKTFSLVKTCLHLQSIICKSYFIFYLAPPPLPKHVFIKPDKKPDGIICEAKLNIISFISSLYYTIIYNYNILKKNKCLRGKYVYCKKATVSELVNPTYLHPVLTDMSVKSVCLFINTLLPKTC